MTAVAKDLFKDMTNNEVRFYRSKTNEIAGYITGNDSFNLLSKHILLPEAMWYPRLNTTANYKYVYRQPKKSRDGLLTGSIDKTELDKSLLSEMVEKIVDGTYPNVHSILIIKDGKLVFEEYFYEHS